MRKPLNTYIARYRHKDRWYTVDIEAEDMDDAQIRLRALAWARYDGQLVLRMSNPTASLWCLGRKVARFFMSIAARAQ
jgi:hypothetical protein